jgi:hypothetical protein
VNHIDIKIKKLIIKSTFPKKAKFRLVIELDTIITFIETPRIYKPKLHPMPIKRHGQVA